jgi:hypothetical protein
MGSDKEDLQRWADLVLDGKPINIDQTLRHQAATIADLRESVRVLAASVRSNANDRAVGKHWDMEVCDEVWANPIAAEAVRKAVRKAGG